MSDPNMLDVDDRAWSKALCDAMITSALASYLSGGGSEMRDLHAAVRAQALDVNTDDGLGAERWLLAMHHLAARSAGLIAELGRRMGRDPQDLWSEILLHINGNS